MALHKEKYKQAILYLCWKLGKEVRGKKKLAKLLYYLDFDFYEKTQRPFTGELYIAFPMGPFPSNFDAITREMVKKGMLTVQTIEERNGYLPTEIYKAEAAPTVETFSEEEKAMLDRVIKNYGSLNGKQLEDLTHAEAPYIGTGLNEIIPYELSFYRGTDFADGNA